MRITCQVSDRVRPCKRHENIGEDLPTPEKNKMEVGLRLNGKVLLRCSNTVLLPQFVVGTLVIKFGI